jgi:hypothetical protein
MKSGSRTGPTPGAAVLPVGRAARELDDVADLSGGPGAGELIVAVCAVLPTLIVTAAVPDLPFVSVTRRVAT